MKERIKEIPNMLKKASIRSRVTTNTQRPGDADAGLAK
jgi:hypothetical protein